MLSLPASIDERVIKVDRIKEQSTNTLALPNIAFVKSLMDFGFSALPSFENI